MELMPGYKQTEVGVIPEDWEFGSLGDWIKEMTDFVAAGSFESLRNNVRVYDSPNYAIYVRLYDLRLGLGHNAQKYVDKNSYAFLSKSNLHGHEVLIANIGASVGEAFLMPIRMGHATIAPNMIVIRTDENKLRYDYLYFYVSSVFGQTRIHELIAGSGHPKINKTDLKKCIVVLPPPPEQRAIAAALSDVDALIAKLDALVAKKRDLKQAAMQQLLTGQTRLSGFSGEWGTRKLRELSAFITKGSTPTTYGFKWENSGILFLRSECVAENGLDLSQSMLISVKAHTILRRSEVIEGDLLLTITGNVGRVVRVPSGLGSININQHIARVRIISEHADSEFIFQFLSMSSVRRHFSSITTGQAYPQISLQQVRQLPVLLPTPAEQTAIAEVLSDMDAEIATLEAERDKTRALKQGMMQELLTGRIRLV
jgi:type I restriction enzyme, S subunit